GARSAGVFLVLANNLEMVREQQQLANEAISEGTSVLDEFEVRSQSFDAVVKRLQKDFDSFFTSDTINKWVKQAVYGLEWFIGVIKSSVEWIEKNEMAVKLWVAAVLIQTKAIQRLITYMAIQLTGNKELTFAQIRMTIA